MKTKNVLRELIREDKTTLGTHMYVPWPGVAEVIGYSGVFDYIEFSGQYAPYDLFSLENFGRAIDMFDDMSAMMKLDQEPKIYLAERAIGSGIQNLLFADIRTVDDAHEAYCSMRPETPEAKGKKGVTGTRDMGYVAPGITMQDYIRNLEEGILALMIEKKPAVEDLENILSVGGIDMVQFGPSDYSMSIGRPGETSHPEVKEAERYVIETAIKMGIRPRAELNEVAQADSYLEMGVKDFTIGTDVNTIYDFCKKQGGSLLKELGR